jgi:hypothetical protein
MPTLLAKIADKLRLPYDWSRIRRAEVIEFLSRRQPLTHEEWQRRFAPDVPIDFVCWFRDTCSRRFEFDLSAALPDDRLIEDLGLYRATWPDVDVDILEDFGSRFRVKAPSDEELTRILTFGEFFRAFWKYAQKYWVYTPRHAAFKSTKD